MIYDSLIVYCHEVRRLLRSLRFRVSFVLIALLFAGGSRLFVSFYTERRAVYRQLMEEEERKDRELSENLTRYANEPRTFRYAPRTDGFLYGCEEEEMVNAIQYDAWSAGGLEVEQGTLNPLLDAKSSVDWTMIVSVFISFVALLFSYDSICGEKRDKVLGYLLSYPVSRRDYWLSKVLSHISVGLLLLLGGLFVGLVALGDSLSVVYTPTLPYKILGFIGISLLLISLCTCFGLFASVATRQSNVSLLVCVSFWLFGTVIIPNSATFWGDALYPTPPLRAIAQEVEERERSLIQEAASREHGAG